MSEDIFNTLFAGGKAPYLNKLDPFARRLFYTLSARYAAYGELLIKRDKEFTERRPIFPSPDWGNLIEIDFQLEELAELVNYTVQEIGNHYRVIGRNERT